MIQGNTIRREKKHLVVKTWRWHSFSMHVAFWFLFSIYFLGEAYSGQQDKSQVIIGILEVVLSDFAREQSETEASEQASVAEYKKFMQEGKVSVSKMSTTANLKEADAKEADATHASAKTDLKNTNKQVAAVAEERAALVPMCPPEHGGTKGVVTFEERTAQRQSEIDSLKQALEMLAPRGTA